MPRIQQKGEKCRVQYKERESVLIRTKPILQIGEYAQKQEARILRENLLKKYLNLLNYI